MLEISLKVCGLWQAPFTPNTPKPNSHAQPEAKTLELKTPQRYILDPEPLNHQPTLDQSSREPPDLCCLRGAPLEKVPYVKAVGYEKEAKGLGFRLHFCPGLKKDRDSRCSGFTVWGLKIMRTYERVHD